MPKRSSGFFLSLSVALSVVVVVVVLYFCCHRHKLFRISPIFPEQLGQSYSNSAQSIFRWRECKCVNSFTEKVEPGKQPRVWYTQVCSNHGPENVKLVWKHPQCRFNFVQIINPVDKVGRQWGSNFFIRINRQLLNTDRFIQKSWNFVQRVIIEN